MGLSPRVRRFLLRARDDGSFRDLCATDLQAAIELFGEELDRGERAEIDEYVAGLVELREQFAPKLERLGADTARLRWDATLYAEFDDAQLRERATLFGFWAVNGRAQDVDDGVHPSAVALRAEIARRQEAAPLPAIWDEAIASLDAFLATRSSG